MSKKKPSRAAKAASAKQPAPIELDERMTIVQAAELHRTLVARLAQGAAIVIDGTRVDTSICGEPRSFSSFLTIWLVFTTACGPLAGLRSWQIRALSLFFLAKTFLRGQGLD